MIRPKSFESLTRTAATIAGDFALAWVSLVAVIELRRSIPLPLTRSLLPEEKASADFVLVMLFGITFVIALRLAGFYRVRFTPRARPILLVALAIQIALVTVVIVATERSLPRTLLFGVPLIEGLLHPLWRGIQRWLLPLRRRATVLVGDSAEVASALAVLDLAGDQRVHVVGYVAESPVEVPIPWLGDLSDSDARAEIRGAEEVIYLGSNAPPRARLELLRIRGPRGYLLLATPADALLVSAAMGWLGDEPLVEIGVGCGYGYRSVLKRVVDFVGAAILTAVSLPLWLLLGIAIWLEDRRWPLIRQTRVGLHGRPFAMWKFRSMRHFHSEDAPEPDAARITRVGRLIRRYRVDELPQLLNVLMGDMSLVGPRPERPEIVARILRDIPEFELRCLVRPGIAGLAQIRAEYHSRPEVKLRYDLTYMCSWSLWLDIRLMLGGVAAALSGSGV